MAYGYQSARKAETERRKKLFIQALRKNGIVTAACDAANLTARLVYTHRKTDANFAAAWEEGLEASTERLEAEAIRRGVDGVDEPLTYQDSIFGHKKRYSDNLLMFVLKKRKPEYRDNALPPPPQRVTFIMQIGDEERHLGSFEPPLIEGEAVEVKG